MHTLDFVQCHSGSGPSIKVAPKLGCLELEHCILYTVQCNVHGTYMRSYFVLALPFSSLVVFALNEHQILFLWCQQKIHLKFNRCRKKKLNCAAKCILHASLERWSRCKIKNKKPSTITSFVVYFLKKWIYVNLTICVSFRIYNSFAIRDLNLPKKIWDVFALRFVIGHSVFVKFPI